MVSLVLGGILLVSLLTGYNPLQKSQSSVKGTATVASAEKIYPLFLCPCCGKPLDKNNICCDEARERINYIDELTGQGKTEKEIILAFVKKYGLNSLVDKNRAKEIQTELVKTAPADRPIISLSPQTFDFGNVSMKKGIVTTLFTLKNEGKSDLVINRLDSSCGCTSAAVVYKGVEGPRFAMAGHGIESPKNWQLTLPAGDQAQVKVYYDPNVHKDLRGAVTREVSIFSNDPVNFESKVTVELNQTD